MIDNPIKVTISGGVRHADSYLALLQTHSAYEVVGLHEDPDAPDWALEDANRLCLSTGLESFDTIPRDSDLVVVCTEPARHASAAIAAMAQGHNVLIDKPAAINHVDVVTLGRRAREANVLCTAVTRCLNQTSRRARAMIDAGHIGFARSIDIEFLAHGAHFATSVERPELVVDASLSGGGEIMNFLGYAVDSIRWLTGCEPEEVYAEASSSFSDIHRTAGVEDTAVISLRCTNGLVASITVGRIPAAPTQAPNASTTRIVGSHGHLLLDDNTPAITNFGTDGRTTVHRVGLGVEDEAVVALFDNIAEAITGNGSLAYSINDAAIALATIDAAYRSIDATASVSIMHDGAATE